MYPVEVNVSKGQEARKVPVKLGGKSSKVESKKDNVTKQKGDAVGVKGSVEQGGKGKWVWVENPSI